MPRVTVYMWYGLEMTIFDGSSFNRDIPNLQILAIPILQVEIRIVAESSYWWVIIDGNLELNAF